MAAANTTPLSMKLAIETATQRVVFAETTKDAVDYLHSLLQDTSEEKLGFDGGAPWDGCIDNLYDTIQDIEDDDATETCPVLRPPPPPPSVPAKRFFKCSYEFGPACGEYVTETRGAVCPSCGWQMATEVPFGSPGAGCYGENDSAGGEGGGSFQEAPGTCVLTDDLTLLSTKTTSLLRNKLSGAVEERTVQLGYKEGMAILEASMRSSSVLTDVFLGKKAPSAASDA